MADLIVDYELLEECSGKLDRIGKFLEGLEARVDADADLWGDAGIAGAMHTFGTNWSYHREKLQDLIDKGAEKFENSKDTFKGNDDSLKKTLVDGGKGEEVTGRGGQWSLLRQDGSDADPLASDEVRLGQEIQQYRDVATEIDDQVRILREIAESHDWVGVKGDYASALADAARSMSDELAKVQGRFDTVASQLAVWQPVLSEGITETGRQLADAEDAETRMQQHPMPAALPTDATDAQTQQHDAQTQQHTQASGDLATARSAFTATMEYVRSVAQGVAKKISDASDDGVKDSWWDAHVRKWIHDHADLLKLIADIATWVATALLIVALFVSGGWIVLLAMILTGVALLIHTLLAAQGDGSWLDVALDVVALATMGAGRILSTGARATIAVRALESEKGITAALREAQVFKVLQIFKVASETRVTVMTEDAAVTIASRVETTVMKETTVAIGDAAKMNEAALKELTEVEKLSPTRDFAKAMGNYAQGVDTDFRENVQALRTLLHDVPGDRELLNALSQQNLARMVNMAGADLDSAAKLVMPGFHHPGDEGSYKPGLLPAPAQEWLEDHTTYGLPPEVQNTIDADIASIAIPGSGPLAEYLEHH